jgi:hypothetical protein
MELIHADLLHLSLVAALNDAFLFRLQYIKTRPASLRVVSRFRSLYDRFLCLQASQSGFL